MTNDLPQRKNIRLTEYDYSQAGYYFVTVCTKNKRCVFGRVVGAGVLTRPQMELSKIGKVIDGLLSQMPSVDHYAVMPNHVHIIFRICEGGENGRVGTPAPTQNLPNLVHYLKRTASVQCGTPLWQRSYYDHIIRNEADYLRIWQYINENPAKWTDDEYYTE